MRSASSSSCVSRLLPLMRISVTAVMRPTMATTTMISISEKPRDRRCTARPRLLVEVPVPDVGIFTFAAFLSVGSEGVEVVIQATLARENELVRIAPGIRAHAPDVAALAPVAHGGIVRPLDQRLQAEVGARILVVIELVHGQGGLEGLDVALGLRDLRLCHVAENIRQNHGCQQPDDHHDDHDFDESETAGGSMHARNHEVPVRKSSGLKRWRIIANER